MRGVVGELGRAGIAPPPVMLEISGSLLPGAGLSSSAALTVALTLALTQLAGAALERRACPGEHLGALVDADDGAVGSLQDLRGDHPGAGRDIEDPLARAWSERIDEGAAPAGVLPEAEGRRDQVVAARQAPEQVERLALSRGRDGHRVAGGRCAHR